MMLTNNSLISFVFSVLVGIITFNFYFIKIKWQLKSFNELLNHILWILMSLIIGLFVMMFFW